MSNVSKGFARDFKCGCEKLSLIMRSFVHDLRCLGNNLLFNFDNDTVECLKFLYESLERSRPTVFKVC